MSILIFKSEFAYNQAFGFLLKTKRAACKCTIKAIQLVVSALPPELSSKLLGPLWRAKGVRLAGSEVDLNL